MLGHRPGADPRFTLHGSWKRVENDAAGDGSFAAVEQSMSDRLLGNPMRRLFMGVRAAVVNVRRVARD